MSKKHFQAIARILANYHVAGEPRQCEIVEAIAEDMATYFQSLNPRFDRGRFIEAVRSAYPDRVCICGITSRDWSFHYHDDRPCCGGTMCCPDSNK